MNFIKVLQNKLMRTGNGLFISMESLRKNQLSKEILNDERVKIYTNYDGNTNIGYVKNKAFSLGTGDILS